MLSSLVAAVLKEVNPAQSRQLARRKIVVSPAPLKRTLNAVAGFESRPAHRMAGVSCNASELTLPRRVLLLAKAAGVVSFSLRFQERAAFEVFESALQFLLRVHDDGAVPRNWLFDRFS